MAISLKAARVNAGLTQEQAAKILEVDKNTIINWEAYRTFPDVRMISKIEEAYHISYNDIKFLP